MNVARWYLLILVRSATKGNGQKSRSGEKGFQSSNLVSLKLNIRFFCSQAKSFLVSHKKVLMDEVKGRKEGGKNIVPLKPRFVCCSCITYKSYFFFFTIFVILFALSARWIHKKEFFQKIVSGTHLPTKARHVIHDVTTPTNACL